MNAKTERVFKGFLSLSSVERQDLIKEINDFYKETLTVQKSIQESYVKRADLGPLLSASCPCCGR